MSHDDPYADRRQTPRRQQRSRGTAYVLCHSRITAIEVETRNISDGGVLLVSREYLHGERMMLKLNLPEYEDSLIECDVAHRSEFERLTFTEQEDSYYSCGLSFRRVIPENNLHETLLDAFRLAEPIDHEDEFEFTDAEDEESLVPVLSAIGLAVVHASRYTIC